MPLASQSGLLTREVPQPGGRRELAHRDTNALCLSSQGITWWREGPHPSLRMTGTSEVVHRSFQSEENGRPKLHYGGNSVSQPIGPVPQGGCRRTFQKASLSIYLRWHPYILQVPDDNVSEVHPVRKKYCNVAGLDWFSGIHFFPLTT